MTDAPSDRVWTPEICGNEAVGDRCLRNWIARDKFPKPDGNLNGRNFWLRSTYNAWKSDVLAGRYAQSRRPVGASQKAA